MPYGGPRGLFGQSLEDFKPYVDRALNRRFGRRRWWADGGSTRKKATSDEILAAARYVRDQPFALRVRMAAEVAEAVRAWEPADMEENMHAGEDTEG